MKTAVVILCSFMFAWYLRDPQVYIALNNIYVWATKSTTDLENTIQSQQEKINSLTLALTKANEQVETQKVQLSYYKIRILKRGINPKLAKTIAVTTHIYARRYGVDPDMVLAIARIESHFDPNAVSPTNI